jgi:hypothetical protein
LNFIIPIHESLLRESVWGLRLQKWLQQCINFIFLRHHACFHVEGNYNFK